MEILMVNSISVAALILIFSLFYSAIENKEPHIGPGRIDTKGPSIDYKNGKPYFKFIISMLFWSKDRDKDPQEIPFLETTKIYIKKDKTGNYNYAVAERECKAAILKAKNKYERWYRAYCLS